MKNSLISPVIFLVSLIAASQSCDEQISYLKNNYYGTTYNSPTSTAVSKVTFYSTTIKYRTLYFAVVCFKGKSYGCNEYLYKVGATTQSYYSMNYLSSAGKAFWSYIEPYGSSSPCAPDLN